MIQKVITDHITPRTITAIVIRKIILRLMGSEAAREASERCIGDVLGMVCCGASVHTQRVCSVLG